MSSPVPSSPFIGIIDDEENAASYLARLLKQSGYTSVTYRCGDEALRDMRQHLPSLVILDLDMPGMDGLECLRRLKADARLIDVPVIMYSGDFTHQRMTQAKQLGALEYVVKGSMNWSDFRALIKRYAGEPGDVTPASE